MNNNFAACEICGQLDWREIRKGVVRDGAFGQFSSDDALVCRCNSCGVERLNEEACHSDEIYSSKEYRTLLGQESDAINFL